MSFIRKDMIHHVVQFGFMITNWYFNLEDNTSFQSVVKSRKFYLTLMKTNPLSHN